MNEVEELAQLLNTEFIPHLGEHGATKDFEFNVLHALREAFITGRPREEPKLRVSKIGYPALDQLMPLLGYSNKASHSIPYGQAITLFFGNFIEEMVVLAAREWGFDIDNMQQEIDYHDVLGHIDFTLGDYVVDVKTMSAGYFNSFHRRPNDERGYITQAAIYSETVGLPFAWLCFNKAERVWSVVYLSEQDKAWALERAARIIPKMQSCRTIADAMKKFKAPEPVPEVFKREETGRFLLPPSMRYSDYRGVWYELGVDFNGYKKKQTYVIKQRSAQEVINFLEG